MNPITIEETKLRARRLPWNADHPLLQLGFRPFYLMAAAFAAFAVPYWVASYFGWPQGWLPRLPQVSLNWHMHEMVFGMALAVIVGFLYTAGRNWTGLWTPRNGHLAALAALWLAGRVAMLFAPAPLAATIDLLFLPLATWPLYRVLKQTGNKRNLFLVALLMLLWLANLMFHAAVLGYTITSPILPIQAAILIITVIESVIGARVIPMFTRNGAPGTTPVVDPRRDQISLVLTVAAGIAWVCGFPAPLAAATACAAAYQYCCVCPDGSPCALRMFPCCGSCICHMAG